MKSLGHFIMRLVALVGGVVLIAVGAHVNVLHNGGYGSGNEYLVLALSAGLVIGAAVTGWAMRQGAWLPAAVIIVGMVAGEISSVYWTVDRMITSQVVAEAAVDAGNKARVDAQARVGVAEAAVKAAETSDRLIRALASKAAAEAAAHQQASERGCRQNCKDIHLASLVSADREIAEAQQQKTERQRLAAAELVEARRALAALPPERTATATATTLGISPMADKIGRALVAALSLNAFGAGLVAAAFHKRREVAQPQVETQALAAVEQPPAKQPARITDATAPREHAARYISACLRHSRGSIAPISDVHMGYLDWCDSIGEQPVPVTAFLPALSELLMGLGIRGTMIDGVPHARNVRIVTTALPAPSDAA